MDVQVYNPTCSFKGIEIGNHDRPWDMGFLGPHVLDLFQGQIYRKPEVLGVIQSMVSARFCLQTMDYGVWHLYGQVRMGMLINHTVNRETIPWFIRDDAFFL